MLITNLIFQDKQKLGEEIRGKGKLHILPGKKSLLQLYPNYQRLFVLPPSLILDLNLNETVSKTIRKLTKGKVQRQLDLELFNVTACKTLKNIDLNIIVKEILPQIDRTFSIKSYELTQSQHEPELVTYEVLLKVGKNFLSVKACLEFGIIKFQRKKGGKSTSVSAVFTNFDQDFLDFFYFMSEMAVIAPNAKDLFSQLIHIAKEHPQIAKQSAKETKAMLQKNLVKNTRKYGVTITPTKELRLLHSEGGNELCAFFAQLFWCAIQVEPIDGTFINGGGLQKQYNCQENGEHLLKISDGKAAIIWKEHSDLFSESEREDSENEEENQDDPITSKTKSNIDDILNQQIPEKKVTEVVGELKCAVAKVRKTSTKIMWKSQTKLT